MMICYFKFYFENNKIFNNFLMNIKYKYFKEKYQLNLINKFNCNDLLLYLYILNSNISSYLAKMFTDQLPNLTKFLNYYNQKL